MLEPSTVLLLFLSFLRARVVCKSRNFFFFRADSAYRILFSYCGLFLFMDPCTHVVVAGRSIAFRIAFVCL